MHVVVRYMEEGRGARCMLGLCRGARKGHRADATLQP